MAKEENVEVPKSEIIDWKRFTVIKLQPKDKDDFDFVYRFTTDDGKQTDYGFYKSDLKIGERILYSISDAGVMFIEGALAGIATYYLASKIAGALKKRRNSQN